MSQGEMALLVHLQLRVLGVILVDPLLDLMPVVPDESLNWPGSSIAQGTDGMSFDLFGQFPEHVDLGVVGLSDLEASHHVCEPAGPLPAGRALAAALVLVELGQSEDALDDVGLLVHHDHRRSAQTALQLPQRVEVHQDVFAELFGQEADAGPAGDDGLEVVPAADHSAAVAVDEFSEGNRHFLLDGAGVVDVAGNAEELGAAVVGPAEGGEPRGAPAHDGRADCHCLHVCDGGRTVEDSAVGREGGF